MATLNITLQPGFQIRVQQGSNPVIPCTIYDRGGNVLDLTGKTVKFAVKRVFPNVTNGLGQFQPFELKIFDITATIVTATLGNITLAILSTWTGRVGSFIGSLRIWNNATTNRNPDDSYQGVFAVDEQVIRSEA